MVFQHFHLNFVQLGCVVIDLFVLVIAEFENVLRCSSFQHPQAQQPPYMMTAGAGMMDTCYTLHCFHDSANLMWTKMKLSFTVMMTVTAIICKPSSTRGKL